MHWSPPHGYHTLENVFKVLTHFSSLSGSYLVLLSGYCMASTVWKLEIHLCIRQQILDNSYTLCLGISIFFKSPLIFQAHCHSAMFLLNSIRSCSFLLVHSLCPIYCCTSHFHNQLRSYSLECVICLTPLWIAMVRHQGPVRRRCMVDEENLGFLSRPGPNIDSGVLRQVGDPTPYSRFNV